MSSSRSNGALGRIINQSRLDHIKAFGFWNASAEQGIWRLVACHRHGQNSGADSETACALYWTNEQAQRFATQMISAPAGKLHRTLDPSTCFRALALAAASQAAAASEVSWTEAGISAPRRDASESATARLLCFNEEEMLGIAAGFCLLAASGCGRARYSTPGLANKARRAAAKLPALAFDPKHGARIREAVSPEADLFSHDGALFDARATARALGLPFASSLMAPAMDHIGETFVSVEKLRDEMSRMPCRGRSLGAHIEPAASASGRPVFDGASPSAVFQSRQDAQALALHLPAPAMLSRDKRIASL